MDGQQDNQASPGPTNIGANEGEQKIITPVTNASSGTERKAQTQAAENVYVKEIKTFFSKNLLHIIKGQWPHLIWTHFYHLDGNF